MASMQDKSSPEAGTVITDADNALVLTRAHARRLRDIHRSAGWPSQDGVEIELLATGLIERLHDQRGNETLRLTDAGVAYLAQVLQRNRQALSVHDALVAQVARSLLLAGRVVWTGLAIRARLPASGDAGAVADDDETAAAAGQGALLRGGADLAPFELASETAGTPKARWKVCKPDVFSIRSTSVAAYLQPVVHEIKVSRADLLGDLRRRDKRDSYLDIGGQCWYVLGCDARGRPIAQADEVPLACGVINAMPDGRLEVARHAPVRSVPDLPFALWMALAKATPLAPLGIAGDELERDQASLQEQPGDGLDAA